MRTPGPSIGASASTTYLPLNAISTSPFWPTIWTSSFASPFSSERAAITIWSSWPRKRTRKALSRARIMMRLTFSRRPSVSTDHERVVSGGTTRSQLG